MSTDALILDTALADLASFLGSHEPERGGALLGPRSINAISHFIPDHDAPSFATSYTSSDELAREVNALEASEPVELKGIAHSHPGGLDRPSELDRQAAFESLAANPNLPRYLMPIITLGTGPAAKANELDLLAPAGELGPMATGLVSSFVAYRERGGSSAALEPARMRIQPVGSSLAAAAELLDATRVGFPRTVDYTGTPMLAADLTAADGSEWDFMFPWSPLFAPMIFRDGEVITVEWDFDSPREERLAASLEQHLRRERKGLWRPALEAVKWAGVGAAVAYTLLLQRNPQRPGR